MHKPFRTTKEDGKADINFYRARFIKPKEMRHNADQEKLVKKVMEIRRTRRLRRNLKIYLILTRVSSTYRNFLLQLKLYRYDDLGCIRSTVYTISQSMFSLLAQN